MPVQITEDCSPQARQSLTFPADMVWLRSKSCLRRLSVEDLAPDSPSLQETQRCTAAKFVRTRLPGTYRTYTFVLWFAPRSSLSSARTLLVRGQSRGSWRPKKTGFSQPCLLRVRVKRAGTSRSSSPGHEGCLTPLGH